GSEVAGLGFNQRERDFFEGWAEDIFQAGEFSAIVIGDAKPVGEDAIDLIGSDGGIFESIGNGSAVAVAVGGRVGDFVRILAGAEGGELGVNFAAALDGAEGLADGQMRGSLSTGDRVAGAF